MHEDLLILFATETGTAQDAADRISRSCRRLALTAKVLNVEQYDPEELINETLVVFVVSTAGSGVEPRSMTPLWTLLLRSDLPSDLFDELHYAVFGLGDTAYERFCWPAKKLCRRLESVGAHEITPRGEGDEQHRAGIDGALDPWIEELLESITRLYPETTLAPPPRMMPPRAKVARLPPESDLSEMNQDPLQFDKRYHPAIVLANTRITAKDWNQDVRHYEFELDEDIQYNPGDVALIHSVVAPNEVEEFLTARGWGNIADEPLSIAQVAKDQTFPAHVPSTATLRWLFTYRLDFSAVPRRSFFQFIRTFAKDDREREKLEEYTTDEGAEDVYEYCYWVKRTIKEVLDDFHSVTIPVRYIFDVFPEIRPREFSIASSFKKRKKQIHLCVAIVHYQTKIKAPRRGICTTYMAQLKPGDRLLIGIKKGFLKLPDLTVPVVCIGPGTGLAPMRSVIEERLTGENSAKTTFYFGCRHADKDQHYGTELEEYQSVYPGRFIYKVACSRDGPEGVKRTYVQDLMAKDKVDMWKAISEGAYFFISGSSNKMPKAVKETLQEIIQEEAGMNAEEAQKYVRKMELTGRLTEECWS